MSENRSRNTEREQGISYAKAVPTADLDCDLVDEDDDELPPDESPEALDEAGLTDGRTVPVPGAEIRFELDESGVAR